MEAKISSLMGDADNGDGPASEALFAALYSELHRVAKRELARRGDVAENLADEKELTQVSEALDKLAKIEAPLAAIVDLKFFCGFSFSEIAAMQGVSERTVQRKWERARLYLHRVIRADLSC
jgi:DNA-directed RNA polymerase specialized sigma24 family protein